MNHAAQAAPGTGATARFAPRDRQRDRHGRRRRTCAALLLGLVCAAHAEDYPSKPIRLLVPLSAGGGMDTVARAIGFKLTESLKQTVVVDNRPGAGGSVAGELMARAAPDGYTLLMASSTAVIYPLMYSVRDAPLRDFQPVSQVTSQPYVLVVHPSLPARSVAEFIALARARPGQLNFASSGNGSLIHLAGELFRVSTGTDLVHVPYKGMSAAYPDLLAGHIQFTFGSIISVLSFLHADKLRGLGVTGRTRAPTLPQTPTLNEAGVPGFDVTQWYGVLAPAATPRPIVARLQSEIAAALKHPDTAARLASDGADAVGSTPEQFAQLLVAERDKWGQLIRRAGIRGN